MEMNYKQEWFPKGKPVASLYQSPKPSSYLQYVKDNPSASTASVRLFEGVSNNHVDNKPYTCDQTIDDRATSFILSVRARFQAWKGLIQLYVIIRYLLICM